MGRQVEGEQPETNAAYAIYYSHWIHGAIHMAVTIPALQTVEQIAARLAVPIQLVRTSLDLLERLGLVRQQDKRWLPGNAKLHVGKDSALLAMAHQSWRMYALTDIQSPKPGQIHYSGLHTLSKDDLDELRQMTLDFLNKTRRVIDASPAEELVCVNMDVFVP